MINFCSKFHIQILWCSFNRDSRFPLIPSQSLPGKQENPSFSASRHKNNSLSVYRFLNSELSNGGIKVEVKRDVKSYFCHQKSNKKAEKLYMKISSALNTSVRRCLNQRLHFLLLHLFRRMSQASVQDQQDSKQTYCRLPPWSFRISFKDTPSHISMGSYGFYLSRIFIEFFSNLYIPPQLRKCFKFMVKITEKYFCESKNRIWSFLLIFPRKSLPHVSIITTPGRSKLPISPEHFLEIYFSPAENGEDYGAKKRPKLNLRG